MDIIITGMIMDYLITFWLGVMSGLLGFWIIKNVIFD